MTKHRRVVYDILMEERDHPTAAEIYDRVKELTPDVALATVYNSLEALVEHGHFHDSTTGEIHDITFKKGTNLAEFLNLPPGATIENLEINIKGTFNQAN